MNIANFGAFLGGMAQGEQARENQRERAAYLLMLQKRQQAADDEVSTNRQALFENQMAEAPFASMPTGAMPPPSAPTTPQPGQPSQAMMQPGAQSVYPPAAPTRVLPPAQPPQQPPQQLPGVQAPQPYAPPQQPQQAAQPAPQQAPAASGFDRAAQILEETKAALATPAAEAVAKDPGVQKAQQAYQSYVDELRRDGIQPGGKKPDLVQMKRMQLLHDQLAVASADAAKHVSADRKTQYDFGVKFADLYAKKQASENILKAREDAVAGANARAASRAGGGAGGGQDPKFDDLDEETKKDVLHRKQYMDLNGGRPPPGMSAGPVNQRLNRIASGLSGDVGDATANKASITGKTQSLAANDKMLTKLRPAFQALDESYAAMLKVADEAKVPGNQPAAEFKNYLQTKMGSGTYANLNRWIYDTQNEMAQLAAAGQNVVAVQRLKNAQELINKAQTAEQLKDGYKQMREAAKIIVGAREDESKRLRKEIASTGKSDNGGGSAPAAGAGPTVSAKAIAEYAKKNGLTEDKVREQLKARGATIGE